MERRITTHHLEGKRCSEGVRSFIPREEVVRIVPVRVVSGISVVLSPKSQLRHSHAAASSVANPRRGARTSHVFAGRAVEGLPTSAGAESGVADAHVRALRVVAVRLLVRRRIRIPREAGGTRHLRAVSSRPAGGALTGVRGGVAVPVAGALFAAWTARDYRDNGVLHPSNDT